MFSYWVLVAFMGGVEAGGPFALEFETERQCRAIIEDVKGSEGIGYHGKGYHFKADCFEVKDSRISDDTSR